MKISPETLFEVARVAREWSDGIHTCAELQKLEPGRRPCTCGRCPEKVIVTAAELQAAFLAARAHGKILGDDVLRDIITAVREQAS